MLVRVVVELKDEPHVGEGGKAIKGIGAVQADRAGKRERGDGRGNNAGLARRSISRLKNVKIKRKRRKTHFKTRF